MSTKLLDFYRKHGIGNAEMAMLALRCDQGLYNVNTGTALVPDIDGDGLLWGLDCGRVGIDDLHENGSWELPMSAREYVKEPPRRMERSWQVEEQGFVDDVFHDDLHGKSTVLAYMTRVMEEEGEGWTFADPCSIAAKVGRIPPRYVEASYPTRYGTVEGFKEVLDAAGGDVAYAMRIAHRWLGMGDGKELPRGAGDVESEIRESHAYSMVARTSVPTNGHEVSELDIYGTKALEIDVQDYFSWKHLGNICWLPIDGDWIESERVDAITPGLSFGDILNGALNRRRYADMLGTTKGPIVPELISWLAKITSKSFGEIRDLFYLKDGSKEAFRGMTAKWCAAPHADELYLSTGNGRLESMSGEIGFDGSCWTCQLRDGAEGAGYGMTWFEDRDDAVAYLEKAFLDKGYLVDHSTAHEAKLETDRTVGRLLEPTGAELWSATWDVTKERLKGTPQETGFHEAVKAKVMEGRENDLYAKRDELQENRKDVEVDAVTCGKRTSKDDIGI